MNRSILLLFSFFLLLNCGNKKRYNNDLTPFQKEMNEFYKDASISPLKEKDLKNFKGLDFFAFDSSYVVNAALTRTPDEKSFKSFDLSGEIDASLKKSFISF